MARRGDPEDSTERGLGVDIANEGIERGSGVCGGERGSEAAGSRVCIA